MPYSRMKTYPGYSYANGQVRMLRLNKKYFQELEHLNPDFIQRLIGYMTERAKAFATNGRKPSEGLGAGSGVEVFYDGIRWISGCTGSQVAA